MPVDNAGNTTSLARNIGTLSATVQTFVDWVGSTDMDDYYRFTLAGTSNLRLNLTGMTADADILVYAANGTTIIGAGYNDGLVNEAISINNLAAGTYYARVLPFSGATNYSLSMALAPVLAAPTDLAGNTVATARNIGALSNTTQAFKDWVGSADTNDYFRFTLSNASDLRLNLTGMTANADVSVYAANGTTVLGTSANTGTTSEALNISNLAVGTYYVRVWPLSGSNTYYRLSLTAPGLDGNTVATAFNIGTVTATGLTITDSVGSTDVNDYYRFTLSDTSNLRLSLADMSADADVVVYAANGTTVVGDSYNADNTAEAINLNNLAAGTYYVLVNSFDSSGTNYRLTLAADSVVMPDFAGSDPTTARNFGVVDTTTQTARDWVGGADLNDYYRFTLSTANYVRFNLTGLSADANVVVYASDGTTVLGSGANTGITSEAVIFNSLAAGTYYARVYPGVATANTNYTLNLIAQIPDAAGNTTATARNIGALSTTAQTFTDWVGGSDTNDYYRFTLNAISNLSVNLTGLGADANVLVYASNGTTVLGTGANTGITSEAVAINNLAVGTYYARVYPGVTAANTDYSLAIAATDIAGNTTATARNLGTLSATTQTVTDWVGSTDTDDYYRFAFNSISNLRVNLTGLSADANLVVYASDGTTVFGTGANTGITSEAIVINYLATGSYYARVYPGVATANTNYSLAISAADVAGNTIATARNIGALSTAQTFTDWVGSSDTNDYYQFTLNSGSNLRLNLTGLGADANVVVYASNGTTVLGTGANTGITSEAVAIDNLYEGTYYARVYPGVATANTNYSLAISATPPPIPDNAGSTATTARNIGALATTTQTFTDWVGSTDTNDYYRFTLGNQVSTVDLNLTGLSADANVMVYAADGTSMMGRSLNTGSSNEVLSITNLYAGTYYARVYSGATTANTNYSLAMAATSQTGMIDTANSVNLGTLSTVTQIFNNSISYGSGDGSDPYYFTVDVSTDVDVSFARIDNNLVWYIDGFLRYIGGDLIGLMTGGGGQHTIFSDLAPGSYSLDISTGNHYDAYSEYSFSLSGRVVSPAVAGETLTTARDIGSLAPSWYNYYNSIGGADSNDYYRFTIDGIRNLALRLTDLGVDADVSVYAADGVTTVGSSAVVGTGAETVNVSNLAAGTYYVRVYPHAAGSTNAIYTMSILMDTPGWTSGTTLAGGTGNDTLIGTINRLNTLVGGSGNDTLMGNNLSDILVGDAGDDILTGGDDVDYFRFLTSVNNGVDTITDFESGIDKIEVISPNFANIPVGTLAANRLVAAGTTLTNANAVFLYNGTTGGLSFDRDGNGTTAAVQIAILTGRPTLTATDIMVIAA